MGEVFRASERLNRDVATSLASSSTQLGSSPKNCQRPSKYTESERPQGTSYVKGTYKGMEQSALWRLNNWIQQRS
jgi:hypothetical protein